MKKVLSTMFVALLSAGALADSIQLPQQNVDPLDPTTICPADDPDCDPRPGLSAGGLCTTHPEICTGV